MRALDRLVPKLLIVASLGASCILAGSALAATITIVNMDGAGEGFNDPTPATPVGGNPGTTVGAQRLYVFQYAAGIWGGILPSNVEIFVQAQFDPQTCDATTGVLGSCGAVEYFRDFVGAPLSGHWYNVALANRLYNSDLNPGANDINATFNSSVGSPTCLTVGWYYGVDGNEGTQIELLPVLLHELGHGLGFLTTTSGTTGSYMSSYPHIFDHYLLDNSLGLHWDQMSAAQRAASAVACKRLVWDGSWVTPRAPEFLGAKPLLRITAPAGIAGNYEVGLASFGPPLADPGVTAQVVLANDGTGTTSDACEALINGADVAGKIALIDRGSCTFVIKVKNAQNAGAVGVIIVDNVAGCPPPGLGGTDETIVIPVVRVTQADGNLIRANIASGVMATLTTDPSLLAGADAIRRVMMYSPSIYQGGSSVSHWDVSASPDLLMEPAINNSLSSSVDLTKWNFADIGWFQGRLAAPEPPPVATRLRGNAPNPFNPSTAIHFSLEREQPVDLAVYDLNGRLVAHLHRGPMNAGAHSIEWNGRDQGGNLMPPGVYVCRLRAGALAESRHMVLSR